MPLIIYTLFIIIIPSLCIRFYDTDLFIITVLTFISFSIVIGVILIKLILNIIKLNNYTTDISNGNLNTDLNINSPILFNDLSNNLRNIELGLNKAINDAIKSERMKSELITNVSHDLKTPLTSIINYVYLLGKDNVSKEEQEKYISILKERSLRLKTLIDDLFEATKAASGNLELHMENLNPIALISQTLGEFEDKINVSNLDFIKQISKENLTIYADGQKTFRIFQNLISNIIKYSLDGTRVYINIIKDTNFISITFKNISKYPLNFAEDEILERFKRGDSARNTEGSGLGLSIAKSLTELQGGKFTLKFDGDLFKVTISLKMTKS